MIAVSRAHRLPTLTLVSVYGTSRLRARCGFVAHRAPALAAKLAAYGPTACYGVRSL